MEMTYANYKFYLSNCIKFLNGKINPTLLCHKVFYSYSEDEVLAKEYNGVIRYNIPAIALRYKDTELYTVFAYLMRMTAHELSHIEQDINYNRYKKDPSYKTWIEKSNELNAISFIMDNLFFIKRNLGEFNHSIIEDKYEYAKRYGTNYVRATVNKMIANILENYYIDTDKARYKDFRKIILELDDSKFLIKDYDQIIDPNILYPVIEELSNFNAMKVFNCFKGDTLIITIQTSEEFRKMQEVVSRIDSKYIIGGI